MLKELASQKKATHRLHAQRTAARTFPVSGGTKPDGDGEERLTNLFNLRCGLVAGVELRASVQSNEPYTTGIRERTSIVLKPVLVPIGCRATVIGMPLLRPWTNQRFSTTDTKHARIYPVSTDPTGIYRGQFLPMQGGRGRG